MDDLKLIKRHYGENMMHLCRELFPTVLETEGKLFTAITSKFPYSRFLYDDLIANEETDKFKNIIFNAIGQEKTRVEAMSTPQELLKKAGYTLYECKTEKDIQSFRHYYYRGGDKKTPEYTEGKRPVSYDGEELCTFNGDRLDRCHVFFAIKDNADKLNREDYRGKEERQDEYGTSVLSIQFSKGQKNTLSIKNRYNHTVSNPDATFGNNLDNIIPGLTSAFEKEHKLKINGIEANDELFGYVLANDGKYYKYNYEMDNIYYCPNNVIVDNFRPIKFDESRYLLFEYFILDMQEKELKSHQSYGYDDLPMQLNSIKNIQIINEEKGKRIIINDSTEIFIDKLGILKKYRDPNTTHIGHDFLRFCEDVREIDLPNVEEIEDNFIRTVDFGIRKISFPKLKRVGDCFLSSNASITELDLPNLEEVGNNFLWENIALKEVNLPKLRRVGIGFLRAGGELKTLSLPSIERVGSDFLRDKFDLEALCAPKLEIIGSDFLYRNLRMKELDLPSARVIENSALVNDDSIEKLNLPKVEVIGNNFLYENDKIEELDLPNLEKIKVDFLRNNKKIKRINLPKVEQISYGFLDSNNVLTEVELPEVQFISYRFLASDKKLKRLILPKLRVVDALGYDNTIGEYITYCFPNIEEVNVPTVLIDSSKIIDEKSKQI